MTKYLTVVYTINDSNAFESTRQAIFDSFKQASDLPFAVTAISLDHEMQRIELIERALEEIDDFYDLRDTIDEIIAHPSIADIKNINDI